MEEAPNEQKKLKGLGGILGGVGGVFAGIGRVLKGILSSVRSFLTVFLVFMLILINGLFAYWMFTMVTSFQDQLVQISETTAKVQKQAVEQAKKSALEQPRPGAEQQAPVLPKVPSVPLEIKAGQGIKFDSGTKIINLADPGGRKYIKLNAILEYAPNDITFFLEPTGEPAGAAKGEGAKAAPVLSYADKFKQELEEKRPIIDDTMITLLSSKTFEEIYSAAGKEQLKKELMALLNSRMPEYRIIFVYFTEFTVQ
jgi:hypothetical protein